MNYVLEFIDSVTQSTYVISKESLNIKSEFARGLFELSDGHDKDVTIPIHVLDSACISYKIFLRDYVEFKSENKIRFMNSICIKEYLGLDTDITIINLLDDEITEIIQELGLPNKAAVEAFGKVPYSYLSNPSEYLPCIVSFNRQIATLSYNYNYVKKINFIAKSWNNKWFLEKVDNKYQVYSTINMTSYTLEIPDQQILGISNDGNKLLWNDDKYIYVWNIKTKKTSHYDLPITGYKLNLVAMERNVFLVRTNSSYYMQYYIKIIGEQTDRIKWASADLTGYVDEYWIYKNTYCTNSHGINLMKYDHNSKYEYCLGNDKQGNIYVGYCDNYKTKCVVKNGKDVIYKKLRSIIMFNETLYSLSNGKLNRSGYYNVPKSTDFRIKYFLVK